MATRNHSRFASNRTDLQAGDMFYEPGDVTHTAKKLGSVPITVLSFELIPWT